MGFCLAYFLSAQVSTDSLGLPKPPMMDHLFSEPMVKKSMSATKKPAASPSTIPLALCDVTADTKADFVVEQSTLAVTRGSAKSYIQCFKKKRLVVCVSQKTVPNHKVFIEKLLKFCKRKGVTKAQVVQYRNKMLG